ERGITIVMVTHELDIARYCKRNVILKDGLVQSDVRVARRLIATEEMAKLKEAEATVMQAT
ncbi:MAG TPA: macrolide ABC transporter ATP-binding protein, partial [Opitutaceae bacterium]